MALSLPIFDRFSISDDPQNAGSRWKKRISRLETMLVAMDVVVKESDTNAQKTATDKRRLALLLHHAGPEVADVYDTLPGDDDEKDTYSKVKPLLQTYFQPKQNVELEVYKFRKLKQDTGETIDAFVTRLRKQAAQCDFPDNEREIKFQVIQGCLSSSFRKLCLRELLSLTKLLEHARSAEAANHYEESIEKSNQKPVNAINQKSRPQQYKKPSATTQGPKSKCRNCGGEWPHKKQCPKKNICRNCGKEYPHREGKQCPATGKTCSSCGKPNHFAKMCRSPETAKPAHTYQKVRGINHKPTRRDSESSSEESIFTVNSVHSQTRPTAQVIVAETPLTMMIDTGSTCNLIGRQVFDNLKRKPDLKTSDTIIRAYGNKPLAILGKFTSLVKSKRAEVKATIYVADECKADSLLSYETAERLDLVKITNATQKQLNYESLKDEFPSLFTGQMNGKMNDYQIKLHIDSSVPAVTQKHRRVGFHLRKAVAEEIDSLLEADIIESVTGGPTPWVSPCLAVPKPKQPGKIRVCVDMRAPNQAILRTRHVIPTIEDLVVDLSGARFFSKLDMNQGYHQLELAEESRYITTFATHCGLYRYKRLNFGINCAAEIFDDTIRQIVNGIPGVVNRSDDILITGKTKEEHDRNLREVLRRLETRNLTLNFDKCEFGKTEITYFGLHFSGRGITPDKNKIRAIDQAAPPVTPEEVASFLGMITFCNRFIPKAAAVSEPLRKLTHKKTPWVWGLEEQNAFEELKKRIKESTTLAYFDIKKATTVIVDASPTGLGAILTQSSKDDSETPIAFASRRLTDVESRYSQTEREALAITWAILHLHLYLTGSRFNVITDHKPLETIFNKPLIQPPARIERWILKLQLYDFKVIYRPGKQNPADFMSRHPLNQDKTSSREEIIAENYVNYTTTQTTPKTVRTREVAEAMKNDRAVQVILQTLRGTQNIRTEHLQPEEVERVKSYKQVIDQLSRVDAVEGDLLLKGFKLVIPQELTGRVIDVAHQSHQGVVKTKSLLREKVWFPNLDKLVETKISNCLPCQSCNNNVPREPIQSSTLPSGPWKETSIDFAELPDNQYLLVIYDDYSRYPLVTKVSTTSAQATIPKLEEIFAMFGIPETVKSDNGSPFQSKEFKDFAASHNFHHRKITPLWPQANGGVERFMKTLKKALRCANADGVHWKKHLSTFLLNYRATPHSTTGATPASAMFGRPLRTKLPEYSTNTHQDEEIRARDAHQKSRVKKHADKNTRPHQLSVGNRVLVKKDRTANKLDPQFNINPYKIVEVKGSMITAKRGNHFITRNATYFRKLNEESDQNIINSEEEEQEEEMYYHHDRDRRTANEDNIAEQSPSQQNQPEQLETYARPKRDRQPPRKLAEYVKS